MPWSWDAGVRNLPSFIVNNNSGCRQQSGSPRRAAPGIPETGCYLVPDIRYDKIIEAFGGHTENVTHPNDLRPALERAYQATRASQVACVNVISDHYETMATRSRRAGALMGYDRN
jgi:acetolactate synthase-1/2/3 large subunit